MGGRVICFVAVLLALCAALSAADVKSVICKDVKGDVVDLASKVGWRNQFSVHVEAVMPDLGNLVNMQMSYDNDASLLRVNQHSYKLNKATFYDYKIHETLHFDFLAGGRGNCEAGTDMKINGDFWMIPNKVDKGQTIGPSDIFRLAGDSGFGNKIQLRDAGDTTFRQLKVKEYVSCQKVYDSQGKALIAKVTHYLSNDKFSGLENGTVPVRVIFEAMYEDDSDSKATITRTYNFFRYQTNLQKNALETPKGIVCENRQKGGKAFPDVPVYVTFSQEIHYPQLSQEIDVIRTAFDQSNGFVAETLFDRRSRREDEFRFDDFKTGLSYAIDYQTNYCIVSNITDAFNMNDYKTLSDGKIRMDTAKEFYDDSNVDYHYGGQEYINGIETERWHGRDPTSESRVYEWYFTTGIKHTVNDYAKAMNDGKDYRIPFKRMMWTKSTSEHYTNYFYEVDYTLPDLFKINLSPCFPNSKSQRVVLFVPALKPDVGGNDRATSLRKVYFVLQKALGVRFTRIAGLEMYFFGDNGYIEFNLLDKHGYASGLEGQIPKEATLDQAMATLKAKIADKSLLFEFGNKKTAWAESEVELVEAPEQLGQSPAASGYSSGALAGLAIAMSVIGVTGGGAGGYWFFIRRS